jgi:cytochrome b6-f complex iron-sulfur subunit
VSLNRRRFLAVAGAATGLAWLGCESGGASTPDAARSCSTPSGGPGLGYCLLGATEVRIPLAARVGVGQTALFNLDDSSAAIVARDDRGFYALSGICTHLCCVLTLCDGTCAKVLTNPGDCAATPVGRLAATGAAFVCACHGSEFAADGSVLSGPADRPLPAVALRRDGDDLIVDLGREVALTDRIA